MFLSVLVLLLFNARCYGNSEQPCSLRDHLLKDIERNLLELKSIPVHTPEYRGHHAANYIRWGKSSCPQDSTLVYDGYAASKHYTKGGSGSNFLCLPKNPEWKEYTEGKSKGTGGIYGVEYQIHNSKPFSKSFLNKDMPCAVCLTARSTALMVPGKINCFEGWHKEFSGYLMSEHDGRSRSPSEYICVDEKLDSVPGGDADKGESIVYPVEAVCGSLKCPPYVDGYAANKLYTKGGSGSNFLCLPKNSEWKEYTEGKSQGTGGIYGVEYEIHNSKPYSKSFLNKDMPYAVCLTARSTALMVPRKINCFDSWHKEYSGYLMSEHEDSTRSPSEYICVDERLYSVPGGDGNRNEGVVYPVEAVCGSLKCPPYVGGRELTCVFCSK